MAIKLCCCCGWQLPAGDSANQQTHQASESTCPGRGGKGAFARSLASQPASQPKASPLDNCAYLSLHAPVPKQHKHNQSTQASQAASPCPTDSSPLSLSPPTSTRLPRSSSLPTLSRSAPLHSTPLHSTFLFSSPAQSIDCYNDAAQALSSFFPFLPPSFSFRTQPATSIDSHLASLAVASAAAGCGQRRNGSAVLCSASRMTLLSPLNSFPLACFPVFPKKACLGRVALVL